jgi:hypothetical protein
MKNITLSIEENTLHQVRKYAAEHNTTVNALVREFLKRKARESDTGKRRREAAARLLELSRKSKGRMEKGWKFDREKLYAERLSRHEHPPVRGGRGEK